jgi:hypothetical protein
MMGMSLAGFTLLHVLTILTTVKFRPAGLATR